jgi:hypothetical protein
MPYRFSFNALHQNIKVQEVWPYDYVWLEFSLAVTFGWSFTTSLPSSQIVLLSGN